MAPSCTLATPPEEGDEILPHVALAGKLRVGGVAGAVFWTLGLFDVSSVPTAVVSPWRPTGLILSAFLLQLPVL